MCPIGFDADRILRERKATNKNKGVMTTIAIHRPSTDRRRILAFWLLGLCAMVFVMVVLGGVTRLTQSGLSMVDWRPISGWLPPLSHEEWLRVFDAYKQFPEYKKLNYGMSLLEFQEIFWMEYIHRLWGRLLGVVFAVPLVIFLWRRWIDAALGRRLVVFFLLGAAQGGMGWYMVKSGLVDQPDVSQYRLTAHLALAVLIYGAMLWTAFDLLWGRSAPARALPVGLRRLTWVILVMVFITMMSGGFVAGLDAGKTYNTFPLMDGRLIPEGLFFLSPWIANFFENIITVQFDHRLLAVTTAGLTIWAWLWAMGAASAAEYRIAYHVLMAAVAVQVTLGISTLLLVVPVHLAAAHQAGALAVLTIVLWVVHRRC